MSDVIKAYAQYISEQSKSHGKFHSGEVKPIMEAEDKEVTKKIAKKDPDHYHIATHGDEHVYGGSQPDHETAVYHVHNTETGKTHSIAVEHGGEKYPHSDMRKEVSGMSKVSTAASKSIHKDLHSNVL